MRLQFDREREESYEEKRTMIVSLVHSFCIDLLPNTGSTAPHETTVQYYSVRAHRDVMLPCVKGNFPGLYHFVSQNKLRIRNLAGDLRLRAGEI